MNSSSAEHLIKHSLPDGRLAHLAYNARTHLLSYQYAAGHVQADLLRDWEELGRHFRRAGIVASAVRIERVSDDLLPPMMTCKVRPLWSAGHSPSLVVLCRASLITPALVAQMNELVLPEACALLRKAKHPLAG